MDYNEEIHRIVDDFVLDILVQNMKQQWEWLGYKFVDVVPIKEDLATITISRGIVYKQILVEHKNGVPILFLDRFLAAEEGEWRKVWW